MSNILLGNQLKKITRYPLVVFLLLFSLFSVAFFSPAKTNAATVVHSSICNSDKYAFYSKHSHYYFFCYTTQHPNQLTIDVIDTSASNKSTSDTLTSADAQSVFPSFPKGYNLYASQKCAQVNFTDYVYIDIVDSTTLANMGCSTTGHKIILDNGGSNATNVANLDFHIQTPAYDSSIPLSGITVANGTIIGGINNVIAGIQVSGGLNISGTIPWYDSKGDKPGDDKQGKNLMSGRLQFVSPLKIYDSTTKEYYIAGSSNGFFDYASGAPKDFIDDGDTIYYPLGGIQGNNKCYGILNVHTSSEGSYPKVYLIPTLYSAGTKSCFVAYQSSSGNQASEPISTFITTNSASQIAGLHFHNQNQNDFISNDSSKIGLNLSSKNKQMFYSMFQWIDQNTIQLYGSTNQLFRLSSSTSPTLQQALTNVGMPSNSNVAVFTNKTCGQLTNAFPMILVNLSSENITTNYDQQGNSSVKGLFYYPKDSKTAQGWSSSQLRCIFGFDSSNLQSITSTNSDGTINGNNITSDFTYLSEPQQSLSSAPVAVPTTNNTNTDTPGDQSPTCETTLSPLTWIICPIFQGAKDFSAWIFSILTSHLKIDTIKTVADSTGKFDPLYRVWQSFRNIGDVLLIIAVIVIIYSEAVGGSIADAYNVRKMLPRILIAAILINLSIYAVNILIDIFNILGVGISDLILTPFRNTDIFTLSPSGSQQLGAFGFGMLGALMAGGTFAATVFGLFTNASLFGGIFSYIFLLALPLIVGAIAVWFTVMVRWGLIILLAIFSPVAFALYTLPNTETYFKKWWKLLTQSLMVFPVVMVIAAIGSILSAIVYQTGSISGGLTGFVLQFLPLIATPLAFKISGGILGTVSDYLTKNGMKWTRMATKGARERKKEELGVKLNQNKKTLYDKLDNSASQKGSRIRRVGARFAQNRLGGRRMLEENSRINAAQAKRIEEANATGSDSLSFADTVDKASADADFNAGYSEYSDVKTRQVYRISRNGLKRVNTTTGKVEYSDIRGGDYWQSEANVDRAHAIFRGNNAAHTGNLRYVLNKSNTDAELSSAKARMGKLIDSWGAKGSDAVSVLKGATIPLQETKLELKFLKYDTNGSPSLDTVGITNELFEKRNSYNLGNLSASTVQNLLNNYNTMAEDQKVKIHKVLETFVQKGGPELDAQGNPTGRIRPDGVSIPGPANTQEKWREFGQKLNISGF